MSDIAQCRQLPWTWHGQWRIWRWWENFEIIVNKKASFKKTLCPIILSNIYIRMMRALGTDQNRQIVFYSSSNNSMWGSIICLICPSVRAGQIVPVCLTYYWVLLPVLAFGVWCCSFMKSFITGVILILTRFDSQFVLFRPCVEAF